MPPRSRIYRLLLHLFPQPFRARFGDDMTQVHADRARDARAAGPVAVVRFWMRTIVDVTRHGVATRRDSRARARGERATAAHAWSALGQDLRDAFRSLRARPGVTTVALVTLALGIGANTAIFSVFHAVLLRDLPYPNADRLVQLYATNRASGMTRGVMNPFDIDQIQTRSHTIGRLTLINTSTTTLTGAGEPARLRRVSVMPSYFSIFGIRPALGRTFTDEEALAAAKVTLISDRLWRQRFGASDAILDRPIELDGRTWTVVGVMPPYVDVPSETDFWWPVELTAEQRADRGSWYLGAAALLEPGVSRDQAQAEIDALFGQIETQYPAQRKNRGVTLVSLRDDLASRSGEGLKRLQAVVACVLLIACANVVNLSLARSTGRRREFAVRAALGASAWRLVRQSLTETMVLALTGAALGTAVALAAVPILVRMAPPFLLPSPQTIGVSWQAIAFTLAIAIFTGLLVGIVPALRSAASAIPDAAGHGDRTSAAGLSWSRRQRLRAGLVVTEIALAFVLLIGAGLLIRSFASLLAHPLGFKPDQMLTAQVTLPTVNYSTEEMRGVFWEQFVARLQAMPGVTTVVASNALPFSQWEWQSGFKIAGREQQPNDGAGIRAVTPGYVAAMGMTIERGRDLLTSDIASAEHVAVVSRTFASQQLAGVDPIGQRFVFDGNPSDWITIVGVTNDALHISLDDGPRVDVYRPMAQTRGYTTMIVGLRTTGEPHALEASLKAAVRDLDPNLPVQMVMTMDELIGRNVASRRFSMTLLASFAGVAGLLAAIGIYGVMAFAVSQGRREIGIRLAIGARPGQVQSRVFGQGLRLTIIGVVIGLAGASYVTRLLRADLVDITPTDPETFAAVIAAVLVLTSLACWIPARRTTQVDPVSVLRAE